MTYDFLILPNRFKSREFKEFSGGCSHSRFNHDNVKPSLSARLILSYRSQAKVFSCFSLLVSVYSWYMGFFCSNGHGSQVSLGLLESTGSVLQFITVDVFCTLRVTQNLWLI